MEKVIAYKAFDGKLFLSEEKCIKYELDKKKYPFEKTITSSLDGTLCVEVVQRRVYISKNRYEKIDSYYQLPNSWKVRSTQNLICSYKEELSGVLWYNLTNYILNILAQINDEINESTLIKYLKYFYHGKIINGYYDSRNQYGNKTPIYKPVENLNEVENKELPTKVVVKFDKKNNVFSIEDSQNYVFITCFK